MSVAMNGLLGKKVGMTQVFTDKGDCVSVTVIQVEDCVPVLKADPGKERVRSGADGLWQA